MFEGVPPGDCVLVWLSALRFSRSPTWLGERHQDAMTGAGRKIVAQLRLAPAKTPQYDNAAGCKRLLCGPTGLYYFV